MAVSELGYQALSRAEGQATERRPGVAVRAGLPVCQRLCAVFNGRLPPPARLTRGWRWPQAGRVTRSGVLLGTSRRFSRPRRQQKGCLRGRAAEEDPETKEGQGQQS